MDSCDSAGRKNKTDGFWNVLAQGRCLWASDLCDNRICLLKPPVYMPVQ